MKAILNILFIVVFCLNAYAQNTDWYTVTIPKRAFKEVCNNPYYLSPYEMNSFVRVGTDRSGQEARCYLKFKLDHISDSWVSIMSYMQKAEVVLSQDLGKAIKVQVKNLAGPLSGLSDNAWQQTEGASGFGAATVNFANSVTKSGDISNIVLVSSSADSLVHLCVLNIDGDDTLGTVLTEATLKLTLRPHKEPMAPIGLQSSNITTGGCKLTWTASTMDVVGASGGVLHYKIYDADTNGLVETSTTNSKTLTLASGITRSFYVKAVNTMGESLPSNTVTVTPQSLPPDISGPSTVCDPATYSVSNVPSACSVSWSVTGNFSLSGPAANPVTVSKIGFQASSGILTATIKNNATQNVLFTLSQNISSCHAYIDGPSEICPSGTFTLRGAGGSGFTWKSYGGFTLLSSTGNSITISKTDPMQPAQLFLNVEFTGTYYGASLHGTVCADYNFHIEGPEKICIGSEATYQIPYYELPAGANITWSVFGDLELVSSNGNSVTVRGTAETSGSSVNAVVTTPDSQWTTAQTIVNVGYAAEWGIFGPGELRVPYYYAEFFAQCSDMDYEFTGDETFLWKIVRNPWHIRWNVFEGERIYFQNYPELLNPENHTGWSNSVDEHRYVYHFDEAGGYIVMCKMLTSCGIVGPYYYTLRANSSGSYYSASYPNPASNILNIEINKSEYDRIMEEKALETTGVKLAKKEPTFDIRLYDSRGNLLRHARMKDGSVQFNVAGLPEGTYYLHVYDGINEKPEMRQIIVER